MAGFLHVALLLVFHFDFFALAFSISAEVSGVEFISTQSFFSEGSPNATVVPTTEFTTSYRKSTRRTITGPSEEKRPKPERRGSETQDEDETGPLELGECKSNYIFRQKETFDDNKLFL